MDVFIYCCLSHIFVTASYNPNWPSGIIKLLWTFYPVYIIQIYEHSVNMFITRHITVLLVNKLSKKGDQVVIVPE